MPLTAIDNPMPATTLEPTLKPALERSNRSGAPGFAESLSAALDKNKDDKQTPDEQQAREAAQQLVASAFLAPLMRMMREGPFQADFLEAGPGRDAFEQMLHTRLADHMVERMELPIVDAVQRFVTHRAPEAPVTLKSENPREKVNRHG